jgi:hypothetical protein
MPAPTATNPQAGTATTPAVDDGRSAVIDHITTTAGRTRRAWRMRAQVVAIVAVTAATWCLAVGYQGREDTLNTWVLAAGWACWWVGALWVGTVCKKRWANARTVREHTDRELDELRDELTAACARDDKPRVELLAALAAHLDKPAVHLLLWEGPHTSRTDLLCDPQPGQPGVFATNLQSAAMWRHHRLDDFSELVDTLTILDNARADTLRAVIHTVDGIGDWWGGEPAVDDVVALARHIDNTADDPDEIVEIMAGLADEFSGTVDELCDLAALVAAGSDVR